MDGEACAGAGRYDVRLTRTHMSERTDHRGRGTRIDGLPSMIATSLGAVALVATLFVATAAPTLAYGTSLTCTARSEAAVFSRWGDPATYFLVSNGGFELGATDWQLAGGASVVGGNETSYVHAAVDTKSLRIPAGGSAESRTFCVSRGEDSIRLFVSNARVPGSILHVQAIVRSDTGQIAETAFDVNGDAAPAGWAPTMRLGIPNLLGGTGTQNLTLVFTTRGTPATWLVDDVYVDPFKSY